MNIEFATKITKTIFAYHLVGLGMDVRYNSHNRTILLIDSETEAILKTIEQDEDLDFDTFVVTAQGMFLEIIEFSN